MTARARLDLGVACAVFPLCCVAFWANHLLAALSPKSVTPYSPVDDSLVYASAYGFGLVGTLLSSYLLVRAVPRWRRNGEEWLYTALIPAPLVGYLSLAVEPLAAWLDLATKVERHVLVSAETFVGVPLLAAALVCVILARRALATPQPAARRRAPPRRARRVSPPGGAAGGRDLHGPGPVRILAHADHRNLDRRDGSPRVRRRALRTGGRR